LLNFEWILPNLRQFWHKYDQILFTQKFEWYDRSLIEWFNPGGDGRAQLQRSR